MEKKWWVFTTRTVLRNHGSSFSIHSTELNVSPSQFSQFCGYLNYLRAILVGEILFTIIWHSNPNIKWCCHKVGFEDKLHTFLCEEIKLCPPLRKITLLTKWLFGSVSSPCKASVVKWVSVCFCCCHIHGVPVTRY